MFLCYLKFSTSDVPNMRNIQNSFILNHSFQMPALSKKYMSTEAKKSVHDTIKQVHINYIIFIK